MKITKHGNRYNRTKKFMCTSCWCEFEADYLECYDSKRVDGLSVYPYVACKCPECGRECAELGSVTGKQPVGEGSN